jgi:integrase
VTRFLSSLAVEGRVAASTQNQALSALLFLYREVLGIELPWLDDIVRAKRPVRLPVVLTREEVRTVIDGLSGAPRLMACLLYGAGLRVLECCRLRVQESTSVPTRSWCVAARVTRIERPCCRPSSSPISFGTSPRSRTSTSAT